MPAPQFPGPRRRGAAPWRPETLAVAAGREETPGAPLNVPPTFASTYRDGDSPRYGRWDNPTWSAFESALGALEGGGAIAFSCGQAAAAAVLATVPDGGTVVHPVDSY
ncbi:MAG: PLP-dependent transferase, partial [Acidimicrobiales bacterium]